MTIGTVTTVSGDSFALSEAGGDIVPGEHLGFFVRDVRFLSHLAVRLDGSPIAALATHSGGTGSASFHGYLAPSGADGADPRIRVRRTRTVAGGLREELEFEHADHGSRALVVVVELGTDFAAIADVRARRPQAQVPAQTFTSSVAFDRPGGDERTLVTLTLDGQPARPAIATVPGGAIAWLQVEFRGRQRRTVAVDVAARGNFGTVEPGQASPRGGTTGGTPPQLPEVTSDDPDLQEWLRRSMQDIEALAMVDPRAPTDQFVAAGSPWYLTLFGRDSIWAALMALPIDPALALGTLRTLARRQGVRVDDETQEQPGKILHEVRHGALAHRADLPSTYYGTVDATPLYVVLAHEAWRWGLDDGDVEPLMDNVEAAREWMDSFGDPDGDGFLEYVPPTGRGLANQGWKDSDDGIRFADGRIALAPLALAEVQGYAVAAARGGADLLDHFGRAGAGRWRVWADDLAMRFREQFWVEDDQGRHPAVALDADKVAVDAVASNMGHLLFTGILDPAEALLVGQRLVGEDMASGYGLRTLSSRSGGYNPLSYHCGSVWPHDTAIAIWGLARTGQGDAAATLLRQLLAAAPEFGHRLPELFAGLGAEQAVAPVPYPSACRPQAWAAGAAWLIARAVMGLEPNVPGGTVLLRSLPGAAVAPMRIAGMPLGSAALTVECSEDGVRGEVAGGTLRIVSR